LLCLKFSWQNCGHECILAAWFGSQEPFGKQIKQDESGLEIKTEMKIREYKSRKEGEALRSLHWK